MLLTSNTVLSAISVASLILLVSPIGSNSKKGIRDVNIIYLTLIPPTTALTASETLLSPASTVLKL